MTNYAKGANLERRTKKILEGHNYWVARTAGSHGPFDILAFPLGPGPILLIQIKANHWPGPDELLKMQGIKYTSCTHCKKKVVEKQIWRWNNHWKEPQIKRHHNNQWVTLNFDLSTL